MKTCKFLCLAFLLLIAVGCSEGEKDNASTESENLELSDIQFDENYKNFSLGVHFKDTFMPKQRIQLGRVELNVTEYDSDMKEITKSAQPIFVSAKNLRSEKIKDLGIKGLVLVDLSLDEIQIEKQKEAVEGLREFVFEDQLYVAFMQGGAVSKTYPVTDYVIDNYFVKDEAPKMLYSSIVEKINELKSADSEYFSNTAIQNKVLIVFSDGHIYNGDKPIDSKQFEYQEILLNETKQTEKLQFCYVNFNEEKDDEFAVENEVENLFTYICKEMGGAYIPEVDMKHIATEVMRGRDSQKVDFMLKLTNPDHKIYRGDERILKVTCMYDGDVIFTGSKKYSLGSVYKPVIVNGSGMWKVIIQTGVFTLIFLLSIYVIFQFIVPYIHYQIFRYKYVTKYTGPNMSWRGIQVPESCYYCKTPFEVGDEIVVKCEHVMDIDCWKENLYKCPEYGRRCNLGKHYYNDKNIFDPKNAPYYMKWLLSGTLAGFVAWFLFGLYNNYAVGVFAAPYFGFFMCFCLTLALSLFSSHGKWLFKRTAIVLSKALVAGLCGGLSYLLILLALMAFKLKGYFYLIDWIPWAVNGYVIACAVAFKTDIKLKKALMGATISMIFAIASMYLWNYSANSHIDTRDLLLVSCLIYSIGLAASLAINYPQSERYFLKVEGPIKTMEIALYKWMNAQFIDRSVTIGKSVDCNLQMSWDINSAIAPIQAELKMIGGNVYLIPLETGVYFKGKSATIDRRIHLYHGNHFTIGQTKFTYIEHDV